MTSTISPAVPLAATLDEPVLRTVFTGAPKDLSVPEDVGAIFSHRMKSLGGGNHGAYVWGSVALAVVGVILGLAVAPGLFAIAGIVAVVWIVVAFYQHSQASGDFFSCYSGARGLQQDDGNINADIPLFDKGDKRKWDNVMKGPVAGHPARLGHYTYTIVTRDSEGNRSESDHDFTVLAFRLPAEVAARFRGVSLAPNGMSFGKLGDKLSSDRAVKLESNEFESRYNLRVVDEQDDIALYELFNPAFLQHLATELKVFWEQRGEDLVFWHKGHEDEAADLDKFCQHGAYVLQRYLEEYR